MIKFFVVSMITILISTNLARSDQKLIAIKVEQLPIIDGNADDVAWSQAKAVSTRDRIENIDILLKAAYSKEKIFFLFRYPDPTENREHKNMVWDKDLRRYHTGPKREDTFSFKWSMEPYPVDLSISADNPYKADVWRFKSARADPLGYADDKLHIYSAHKIDNAKRLLSKRGKVFYLARPGDSGRGTYSTMLYREHQGDEVPKFKYHQPEGSRADIKAKGSWHKGVWAIEFQRQLDTGHLDDIRFDTTQLSQFGVSRHEIAGKKPNPKAEQPNYGTGEIGENLTLVFE